MNLLSGGVMLGLLSSYGSSQMQGVAMKEYNSAKSRGDEAAMESSMGYATKYGGKAMRAVDDIQEALADNVEIAEAEKKTEAEAAALENRQTKKTAAINANSGYTGKLLAQLPSERPPQPAAVLELSDEYIEWKTSSEEPYVIPIVDETAPDSDTIDAMPTQPLSQKSVMKDVQIYAKVNQSIVAKQLK